MIPAGVRQIDQQDHFDDADEKEAVDLPQGRHRAHHRQ